MHERGNGATGATPLSDEQRAALVSTAVLLVVLESWFERLSPEATVVVTDPDAGGGEGRTVHALTAIRATLERWRDRDLATALGIADRLGRGG
jgi:hypothetical protein